MKAGHRLWMAGVVVAGVGVVLVRVVAPRVEPTVPKLIIYGLGFAAAFAGLIIIMAGIKKSTS